MVRFCQFIIKILSGNEILTSIKGRNSVKILQTINNPKLDLDNVDVHITYGQKLGLVNVDVHTKFGQILSICSQGIELKRNSDVNQGP